MPALKEQLAGKLDVGQILKELVDGIAPHASNLQAVAPPASADQVGQAQSGAAQADTSPIGPVVAEVVQAAGPLLAQLPGVGDVMRPLLSAVETIEQLSSGDLPQKLAALGSSLAAELDPTTSGGPLGTLLHFADAIGSAPEGQALIQLLTAVLRGFGVELPANVFSFGDTLPALDGTVRVLGGLMSLQTVLAESDRLTAILAAQLDPASVQLDVSALMASFSGPQPLADFIATLDPTSPADAAAATAAVDACVARMEGLRVRLASAMGFGEATLVYLDVDKVQAEAATYLGMVRAGDLDPLGRTVRSLLDKIQPLVHVDVSGAAAGGIDGLLTTLEGKVGELAAKIGSFDSAGLVQPLTSGIGAVTGIISKISDVVTRITVAIQGALHQVRDVVAALPLQQIADVIKTALAPVTAVLDFIRGLVADIEAALKLAVGTATAALGGVEGAVDAFKTKVDAVFGELKVIIEGLHIDQIAGAISDNVKAFSAEIAKAQLKPYFDTATDAIGGAASVISKIPFGLLPDSMKQKVDDAVAPIKEVDASAVQGEIEDLLQISGGKFQLRGTIDDALQQLQHDFDDLLTTIKGYDPRTYQIDGKTLDQHLADLATQISALTPEISLQPVQAAIDQVKSAIRSFDIDHALDPVRHVFQQILATIDQYSPAKLIDPVEARLKAARDALTAAVKLDQWAPTIEQLVARGKQLANVLDPTQLTPKIQAAFDEVMALVNGLPSIKLGGGLGAIVAMLLSGGGLRLDPGSFGAVLDWLGGAPGTAALAALAQRISDAVARTRDAVQAIDPTTLGAALAQGTQALRSSVGALPAGAGRDQIQAAVDLLQPESVFGDLAVNRDRYLAALTRSAQLAETLRRTGFSEVDEAVGRFRVAVGPFGSLSGFLTGLLGKLGITGVQGGIAGVIQAIFSVASPARLAGLLTPVFVAFQGRVATLIDAVATPILDGIHQLTTLVAAIDLQALRDAVQSVVDEVKTQLQALDPDVVLKAPLDAFKGLQTDLLTFDPLKDVLTILDTLRDTVVRVLGKLKVEIILATPLAVFDEVIADLSSLKLAGLLDPLFQQLDALAAQVDQGLTSTVGAFEQLQAALPGGGDGGDGSASVSVGVG